MVRPGLPFLAPVVEERLVARRPLVTALDFHNSNSVALLVEGLVPHRRHIVQVVLGCNLEETWVDTGRRLFGHNDLMSALMEGYTLRGWHIDSVAFLDLVGDSRAVAAVDLCSSERQQPWHLQVRQPLLLRRRNRLEAVLHNPLEELVDNPLAHCSLVARGAEILSLQNHLLGHRIHGAGIHHDHEMTDNRFLTCHTHRLDIDPDLCAPPTYFLASSQHRHFQVR